MQTWKIDVYNVDDEHKKSERKAPKLHPFWNKHLKFPIAKLCVSLFKMLRSSAWRQTRWTDTEVNHIKSEQSSRWTKFRVD